MKQSLRLFFDVAGLRQRLATLLFIFFTFVSSVLGVANAGEISYTDPEDGRFDVSEYLLDYSGFLPVPIIITEPALDFGGGLGALWFSESFSSAASRGMAESGRKIPPAIGALFGFKTGNDSWGAGGGVFVPIDGDRYRYVGGAGKVGLNLDYFSLSGRPSAYALDGIGFVQQFLARVSNSDWFVGPRYVYFKTSSSFESDRPSDVAPRELDMRIGMLTLVVDYDSRDNIFTANRGSYMEAEMSAVREGLGATMQYNYFGLRGYHYLPLNDTMVLGLRGDMRGTSNGAPFFALPYVSLRGVPAVRYQDSRTAVVEVELRWNLDSRWALVGFAGSGKAYGKRADWQEAETVNAGGLGFRYLLARKLGLYVGADFARGPEENAFYIQVGSAWR